MALGLDSRFPPGFYGERHGGNLGINCRVIVFGAKKDGGSLTASATELSLSKEPTASAEKLCYTTQHLLVLPPQ